MQYKICFQKLVIILKVSKNYPSEFNDPTMKHNCSFMGELFWATLDMEHMVKTVFHNVIHF